MTDPIPVTSGFGWTAAGAWGAFLTLLALIIRQIGPWRKQTQEATDKLIDDLTKRLDDQTRRVDKLERTLDRERARHRAERALDRHKHNNLQQCFDALMLMLDASPEKATEIVARVKKMRETQLQAEAVEKGAIHAAEIAAASDDIEQAGEFP